MKKSMAAKAHLYDEQNLRAANLILARRDYFEEFHTGLFWNAVATKERIERERAKEREKDAKIHAVR